MAEETKVERTTAWIDKELIRAAKATAEIEAKGEGGADVIEQELRGPLMKRYRRAINREHAELGEAGA